MSLALISPKLPLKPLLKSHDLDPSLSNLYASRTGPVETGIGAPAWCGNPLSQSSKSTEYLPARRIHYLQGKKNLAGSPGQQVTLHPEHLSAARPRLRDAEFCPRSPRQTRAEARIPTAICLLLSWFSVPPPAPGTRHLFSLFNVYLGCLRVSGQGLTCGWSWVGEVLSFHP